MAMGDWPYPWPWTTTVTATPAACGHGTPCGMVCWYCQHPAMGPAAPFTFQVAGWQCAGCGHGFAPSVTECPYCPGQREAGLREGFTDLMATAMDTVERIQADKLKNEVLFGTPCACSREGGLCGCDEADEPGRPPCTSSECSC